MKIYLGIKYHPDHRNKEFVDALQVAFSNSGHEMFCVARDLEQWGKNSFSPSVLMQKTFDAINAADIVLIDLSEKGVGLGIEAGYAHAKGKQLVTILQNNSDLSTTLAGISKTILRYENSEDLIS